MSEWVSPWVNEGDQSHCFQYDGLPERVEYVEVWNEPFLVHHQRLVEIVAAVNIGGLFDFLDSFFVRFSGFSTSFGHNYLVEELWHEI